MAAQLYYTPTSCGAANFIAAYKAGLIQNGKIEPFEADIRAHVVKTGPKAGQDFYAVNPKGNVPTLVLSSGVILNENAACLQYIADLNPSSKLAPANGTEERYVLQNKLSFIGGEIHKAYGPFFRGPSEEQKVPILANLRAKLTALEKFDLANGRKYIVGDDFTVADSYLHIVLGWSQFLGFDLAKEFPALEAYRQNIANLDFVKEAHAEMAKISATASS